MSRLVTYSLSAIIVTYFMSGIKAGVVILNAKELGLNKFLSYKTNDDYDKNINKFLENDEESIALEDMMISNRNIRSTDVERDEQNHVRKETNCYWMMFMSIPLYFCPTESKTSTNDIFSNDIEDSFIGEDSKDEIIRESPIDLIPAKPKRKPSRDPPSPHHGKSINGEPETSSSDTMKPLNKCTNAVISCCGMDSTEVDQACFEQMNCPGPFWDFNPCGNDNMEAVKYALVRRLART